MFFTKNTLYMGLLALSSVTLMSAKTTQIYTLQELSAVLTNNSLVVAKFSMPGCPPCIRLKPVYESVSNISSFQSIPFIEIELSSGTKNISSKFGVRSYPTLIIFKQGVPVFQEAGYKPASQITDIVQTQLNA